MRSENAISIDYRERETGDRNTPPSPVISLPSGSFFTSHLFGKTKDL
jgi:hypothetical protein